MIAAIFSFLLASGAALALPFDATFPARYFTFDLVQGVKWTDSLYRGCATHKDPAAILADEQRFRAAWANIASISDVEAMSTGPIPIVFHVIQKSNDLAGGNIPDSMIQAQIDSMNRDYAYVILSC